MQNTQIRAKLLGSFCVQIALESNKHRGVAHALTFLFLDTILASFYFPTHRQANVSPVFDSGPLASLWLCLLVIIIGISRDGVLRFFQL